MDYSTHFNPNTTPQNEQASPKQVRNSAGGYSFQADDWSRLNRFLILGSEGGAYYIGERKLTRENANVVERCLAADPVKTVSAIRDISMGGRAAKNSPAIFALAIACSSQDFNTRQVAFAAVNDVCRTGTHLFEWIGYIKQFRGIGRLVRKAIQAWYDRPADKLAYQLVKYQQRNGWSHRDVLRLGHPTLTDPAQRAAVDWACRGSDTLCKDTPDVLHAFETLKHLPGDKAAAFIAEHRLTREMVPSQLLNDPDVWMALLQDMPMTALVRNLGKMSSVGVLNPMSEGERLVVEHLSNEDKLRSSRLHPLSVLNALRVYSQGRGIRGKLSWGVNGKVADALDSAFYAAFGNVKPTRKRILLALDVSGSMAVSINGMPALSCRDASAAMAMVTAKVESHWGIVGFTGGSRGWHVSPEQDVGNISILGLSPNQRLDDIVKSIGGLPFGATDCALPMMWATANGVQCDTFIIYTDSETYAGSVHPHQALQRYRDKTGIHARLIVVGMASNGFTIAKPDDPGMLDVVGFDTATPNVISAFTCGEM